VAYIDTSGNSNSDGGDVTITGPNDIIIHLATLSLRVVRPMMVAKRLIIKVFNKAQRVMMLVK